MTGTYRIAAPALAVVFAAAVLALCGCAGRTAANMEPKGETVEVVMTPAAADSEVSAPDSAEMESGALLPETEQS